MNGILETCNERCLLHGMNLSYGVEEFKDMNTDPNWLLSTVVQSAAAFVAIVAGFIVSRLLALSAERNGIKTRIIDLKVRLKDITENLNASQDRLIRWAALDYLNSFFVTTKVIQSEGEVSLAEIWSEYPAPTLSMEDVQPYWEGMIETTQKAFRILRQHWSEMPEQLSDLDKFFRKLDPEILPHQLRIYTEVYSHLYTEQESRKNIFSALTNAFAEPPFHDIQGNDETQRYMALEQEVDTLKKSRISLDRQIQDLEEQLKYLGVPDGVTGGLGLLAYLIVTGILIPVVLLPMPAEQFTPSHKWVIFGLFASGLLGFLFYVFNLNKKLAND